MNKKGWQERYKTKVAEFEKLYESLVEMTDRSIETVETSNPESIYEILAEFTNNFNTFFNEEERILRTFEYPELPKHRQAHRAFIKRMLYFRRGSEENSKCVSEEVLKFLKQWREIHLLENDKAYFSFIRVQLFLEAHQG